MNFNKQEEEIFNKFSEHIAGKISVISNSEYNKDFELCTREEMKVGRKDGSAIK